MYASSLEDRVKTGMYLHFMYVDSLEDLMKTDIDQLISFHV